jgi:hypothetical protein
MPQEWMFEFAAVRRLSDNIFEVIPQAGVQVDRHVIDAVHHFFDEHSQPFTGILVTMQHSYSYTFEGISEITKHPHFSCIARLAGDESKRLFADYMAELERDLGRCSKSFLRKEAALHWLAENVNLARSRALQASLV